MTNQETPGHDESGGGFNGGWHDLVGVQSLQRIGLSGASLSANSAYEDHVYRS